MLPCTTFTSLPFRCLHRKALFRLALPPGQQTAHRYVGRWHSRLVREEEGSTITLEWHPDKTDMIETLLTRLFGVIVAAALCNLTYGGRDAHPPQCYPTSPCGESPPTDTPTTTTTTTTTTTPIPTTTTTAAASCSDGLRSECAAAAPCFSAGCDSATGETKWTGVFAACEAAGAGDCVPCYPDSPCGGGGR